MPGANDSEHNDARDRYKSEPFFEIEIETGELERVALSVDTEPPALTMMATISRREHANGGFHVAGQHTIDWS